MPSHSTRSPSTPERAKKAPAGGNCLQIWAILPPGRGNHMKSRGRATDDGWIKKELPPHQRMRKRPGDESGDALLFKTWDLQKRWNMFGILLNFECPSEKVSVM
ncbi:hypothetical protein NDU88_007411 [Pleurodeles waltl]|uniref:Uncharacterized protein n=1 Tax=Pleurodeles waltl TaxID=8319 RepID=A0AAV7SSJ9_PLEWA|nr:hypothetical protein NDU88_007411 [Pleurodeles waltl]